eukprot:scaffold86_cov338-Pavlova_lutheri.AAC.39
MRGRTQSCRGGFASEPTTRIIPHRHNERETHGHVQEKQTHQGTSNRLEKGRERNNTNDEMYHAHVGTIRGKMDGKASPRRRCKGDTRARTFPRKLAPQIEAGIQVGFKPSTMQRSWLFVREIVVTAPRHPEGRTKHARRGKARKGRKAEGQIQSMQHT